MVHVSCQRSCAGILLSCPPDIVRVEKGSGLTPDHSRTRPADILALDWYRGSMQSSM